MERFKGILYCWLWISSIIAGYMGLFCPLLPILLISNKLYRYITDYLFTFWQQYPTALLQLLCGCEIIVTGDWILPGETSLIVMNHRTRTDWNFMWPAAYHATYTRGAGNRLSALFHPLKYVLKDAIRHIPGPGWVMQLSCFLYIRRSWIFDQIVLQQLIDYFSHLKYKYSLLIFPEGTDFTDHTLKSSHRHAEKHNLQKYEYVLHPRTKGFTFLAHRLLSCDALDSVHDVTLLYPDRIPQTENSIINGLFPKVVRMHFHRHDKSSLPKSETGLKLFLEDLWMQKEETLKNYHQTGKFLTGPRLSRNSKIEIIWAAFFWTVLPIVVIECLFVFPFFRNIVICHSIFMLLINTLGGFHEFEIGIYNFKRNFVKNPW